MIRLEDIQNGKIRNRRYRNSRIGDFLKEIELTEGKGTGIPTIKKEMKQNGSPEPVFETDDDRSYFIVTLPIHNAFEQEELVNEPINEPINLLNYKFNQVFRIINQKPGINRIEICEIKSKSLSTIWRELKILIKIDVIGHRGSKKIGGYFVKG